MDDDPADEERSINFDGEVHPSYLDVAEQFRRLFRRPGSGGGALTVLRHGEPVVDVWAGEMDRDGERPWQHDTMALSFSTTKGVASTVIHRLADRDMLDLMAPVAAYWPDFAAAGKQDITITDVLTHRAGLHEVGRLIDDPTDVLDHETMEKRLAAAPPSLRSRRRSGYHGFTFGWLLSGIARAVTGLGMRELFEREVAEPLGLDGLVLGVAEDDTAGRARVAELHDHGVSLASVLGSPVGRLPRFRTIADALYVEDFDTLLLEPPYPVLGAEMPAVNGCFSAHSLARVYAALAAGGTLDGERFLSPRAVRRATVPIGTGIDHVLYVPMRWRRGYHQAFTAGRSPSRAFGHYGYGGSGGWGDPDAQLAVAFVTNRMGSGTTPIADSRLMRLNSRILRAVERTD